MKNDDGTTSIHKTGQRYLNFSLGAEKYAVPLMTVKEVLALPKITPVPETPAHYLGLMNIRGEIIPVIDLRKKMNIKASATDESTVIIIEVCGAPLGALVDAVNSVLSPTPDQVSEKPVVQAQKSLDFITGVCRQQDELILFLDLGLLLNLDSKIVQKNQPKMAA